MNEKMCFCLLFKDGLLPVGVPQNCLLKKLLPAFGCGQHPKAGQNTQHITKQNQSLFCSFGSRAERANKQTIALSW